MFAVTIEDAIAIHRSHQQGGDDAALIEVRRRWPGLAGRVHREVLDRVMRMKVEVPTIPDKTNPPSPGVPEDDPKRAEARERKRARAREQDRARRERERASRE